MVSSSTGSNDAPRAGTTVNKPDQESSSSEITPFLESVLSETASLKDTVESLTPQELSALLEVVGKYRGESLCLHPIGKELVLAMLSLQLSPALKTTVDLNEMAAEIAATLFDDPWARSRLLTLWTCLSEAIP